MNHYEVKALNTINQVLNAVKTYNTCKSIAENIGISKSSVEKYLLILKRKGFLSATRETTQDPYIYTVIKSQMTLEEFDIIYQSIGKDYLKKKKEKPKVENNYLVINGNSTIHTIDSISQKKRQEVEKYRRENKSTPKKYYVSSYYGGI